MDQSDLMETLYRGLVQRHDVFTVVQNSVYGDDDDKRLSVVMMDNTRYLISASFEIDEVPEERRSNPAG